MDHSHTVFPCNRDRHMVSGRSTHCFTPTSSRHSQGQGEKNQEGTIDMLSRGLWWNRCEAFKQHRQMHVMQRQRGQRKEEFIYGRPGVLHRMVLCDVWIVLGI